MSNGYTQYQFLAEIDDRTSDICEEWDGEIRDFADAVVGEKLPTYASKLQKYNYTCIRRKSF